MIGFEDLAGILGCIALFLFAIKQLSDIFNQLFTNRVKRILERSTSNLFRSLLVGVLVTLLLDSSSAVIILTIVFINSGALDLKRGIGIALGANIGTTLQSQLFAFDYMQYSFFFLIIGIFHIFFRDARKKAQLSVLFYMGMLFFTLFLIGKLVSQPETFHQIDLWLRTEERSPLMSALGGGLFTILIQSSGAMVGLTITLAKERLLSQSTGIAIMLGAELGTTANTLVATIGGKKTAFQLALFNLIFNVLSITLALLFFPQFVHLIEILFGHFSIPRQIANAHILFNILGVLLILPFVSVYVRAIKRFF